MVKTTKRSACVRLGRQAYTNTIYDPQENHIHVVTWQFGWTTSSDSEMFIQHDSVIRISVTKLKMIFEHLLTPGYLRLGVSIHSVSKAFGVRTTSDR